MTGAEPRAAASYPWVWFDLDDTIWNFTDNSLEALAQLYEAEHLNRWWADVDSWRDNYHHHNTMLWALYTPRENRPRHPAARTLPPPTAGRRSRCNHCRRHRRAPRQRIPATPGAAPQRHRRRTRHTQSTTRRRMPHRHTLQRLQRHTATKTAILGPRCTGRPGSTQRRHRRQ